MEGGRALSLANVVSRLPFILIKKLGEIAFEIGGMGWCQGKFPDLFRLILAHGMALNISSEFALGMDLLFHLMYVCSGLAIRPDCLVPRLDRIVLVRIGNP